MPERDEGGLMPEQDYRSMVTVMALKDFLSDVAWTLLIVVTTSVLGTVAYTLLPSRIFAVGIMVVATFFLVVTILQRHLRKRRMVQIERWRERDESPNHVRV